MLKIKQEYLGIELVFHLPNGESISADNASQEDLKKAKEQKGNEKFFEVQEQKARTKRKVKNSKF